VQDLEGKMIKTASGTQYLLTEKIGEGAQGVVYDEAMDKFLIKLYKKGSPIQDKNKLQKLRWLEIQNYPDQFIKPLEIIEEPFIGYVMKKVKGHVSLNKLLIPARDTAFSEWYNSQTGGLRRRLFLGYKIAMQFALLHESNRAYCDISGTNILVNEDPGIASVCMIDIDNIYIPGGNSGNVLGTSRYMAPEIINRQMEPDIFTDDYSLAVILFELLTTGHPYVGDIVINGTPEMQTQAYLGLFPYIDDPDADINKPSQMLPVEAVMTNKIRKLFQRTFIKGKDNRMERVPARDFAIAFLEASNLVMKCPVCGNWHIAKPGINGYECPWCDDVNPRPLFLQFKDRYDVDMPGTLVPEEKIRKDYGVISFVLKDEVNSVTDNYISNMYIKRDKFSKPIDQYFVVRKAKDGKFYIINKDNNELYLQKAKQKKLVPVTSKDKPMEISQGDRIFFDNIAHKKKAAIEESDGRFKGILFRYAIVR